jgi:glycosyltransferase involved in cell wall biosynthesis
MTDSAAKPEVSIIVPARNEQACLGSCLQSLLQQKGVDYEILVVDDGSTDRTREIAASFPGVAIIDAPALPPGWIGKNNAVLAGARAAQGEWLLFTDADTIHRPGALARALEEAKKQGAALLSYSPQQTIEGFWQKAVMPVIFAELARTYRPAEVSDPQSPAAAANGQYLLVSRDAYEAVGGHASVATNILEDVVLARRIKQSGRKIYFRYGGDAVSTRMYRSFPELLEGWTKNLVLLFPHPGRLAAVRALEFVMIAGGALGAGAARAAHKPVLAAALGSSAGILAGLFLRRIRRAHFSWEANCLSLVGLPVFSYLLLRSVWSYRRGKLTWKGRSYAPADSAMANGRPQ